MVWECKTSLACECRTLDRSTGFKTDFHASLAQYSFQEQRDAPRIATNKKIKGQEHQLFLQRLRAEQQRLVEQDAWHLVVTNYAKRLISFDTDRLPALSGLAKAFLASGDKTYLTGNWIAMLLEDLTWQNTNHEASAHPSTYIAPSWSWASIANCNPQFYPRPDVVDATRLHAECSLASIDPTGRVSDGYLEIDGPVQRCTLFFQERDFFQENVIWQPNQVKKRRFYVSLDKLRDDQTYEVQHDMNISNYTGVFSDKPDIKRILKVRHMCFQFNRFI